MERLIEIFSHGGPLMLVIAGVSVVAWYLTVRTWWFTGLLLGCIRQHGRFTSPVPVVHGAPPQADAGSCGTDPDAPLGNPSGRFAFEVQVERLDHTVAVIRALAMGLPLLGLLGTVLGMLVSFEVIQVHGTAEPRLLAGGVGQALLTTQAGLWTALPVLFFHHVMVNRVRRLRCEIGILCSTEKPSGPPPSRSRCGQVERESRMGTGRS